MTERSSPPRQNEELDAWVTEAVELVRRGLPGPRSAPPIPVFTRPRSRARGLAWTFGAFAAAAMAVAVWRLQAPAALTYEVLEASASAARDRGSELRFSDGTRAVMRPGARARVTRVTPAGARLALERGAADLDVTHRPGAAWTVDAGPFVVRVIGTRFTLAWHDEDDRFELATRAGVVEVTGPLLAQPTTVGAGERMVVSLRDGRVDRGSLAPELPQASEVARVTPPRAEPRAPTPTVRTASPRPASRSAVPPARPRTTLPGPAEAPPPASDADLVARAEAEGIDHVLASATPSALIELADAARYTRRFSLARRSLTTLRARFPGSPAAADAAFALGVLSEDVDGDARGALGWYDRCLRDAPNGRYASECLGRKLVATRRLAGDAAAVDVAREYLRRFPGGSYVAVARTLAARGE